MPRIDKPKKLAKNKIAKNKTKKPIRKAVKAKSTVLVKSRPKSLKNPAAYYECMKACCKNKLKGKKITQVAHECKTNALTINAKMSAQKTKAVKQIKAGYEQLGKGLGE